MDDTNDDGFDQWCVIDLFGHQRFAGRVRKAEFPPDFLRLDVPATPGHGALTQLISPKAVYALTPTTEAVATAVAERCRPEPVHRWELQPSELKDDEEWRQAGMDATYDPDPDYGKDLDEDDDDDEEPF